MKREEIKDKFKELAMQHSNAFSIGDHRVANRLQKQLEALYSEAKESRSLDVFAQEMENSDQGTVVFAATFSLTSVPQLAIEKLTRESQSATVFGMKAKMILDMWGKGMLNNL